VITQLVSIGIYVASVSPGIGAGASLRESHVKLPEIVARL
jgi:hypothetical protein